MGWHTLRRKASVTLKTRRTAKDEPVKIEYWIVVQTGEPSDYEAHWTAQSMNAADTLRRILNTKNAHDATESTEKGIVRKAMIAAEKEIVKENAKITTPALIKAISKRVSVIEAIKEHDKAARQFVIGNTRGADGELTKTQAAKLAIEALKKNPEAFKEFIAKQGLEI